MSDDIEFEFDDDAEGEPINEDVVPYIEPEESDNTDEFGDTIFPKKEMYFGIQVDSEYPEQGFTWGKGKQINKETKRSAKQEQYLLSLLIKSGRITLPESSWKCSQLINKLKEKTKVIQ